MSKVWIGWLCLVVLLALAGCQTPSRVSAPLDIVTLSNEVEIAPAAPLTNPPPEIVPAPTPVIVKPSWPSNWVNVWIPLEHWRAYNQLAPVTLTKSNPHPIYNFQTELGEVALRVGTRVAQCNGLEFWLGYAPQVLKSNACIHWLDAQKLLQPMAKPSKFEYGEERVVVLDPGHGGLDSGAKSADSGHYEEEYTLDWAQRLGALLETNGWKVIMTRNRDVEVGISDRIAIADQAKADLFISLHFNSGGANREMAGIETYCLSPAGMPSTLLRTQEDDLRQVHPNNEHDELNFQLALAIHARLLGTSSGVDRGLRHARFMAVLRGQNRPAVLIEGGYLSNLNEARKIATPEYRQQLAEGVFKALQSQLGPSTEH